MQRNNVQFLPGTATHVVGGKLVVLFLLATSQLHGLAFITHYWLPAVNAVDSQQIHNAKSIMLHPLRVSVSWSER